MRSIWIMAGSMGIAQSHRGCRPSGGGGSVASHVFRDMVELAAQRVPIMGAAWGATEADLSLTLAARDLVANLSEAIPKWLRPVVLDAKPKPFSTGVKVGETFDCPALGTPCATVAVWN